MALKALHGLYHPRNYTEFEKDLAILIYELGGGAALYALNKAPIMLPSRHAIAEIRRNHSLRIAVGDVTVSALMENILIRAPMLQFGVSCVKMPTRNITCNSTSVTGTQNGSLPSRGRIERLSPPYFPFLTSNGATWASSKFHQHHQA
jgi:hypothetical protein